jgi:hypothetical protein
MAGRLPFPQPEPFCSHPRPIKLVIEPFASPFSHPCTPRTLLAPTRATAREFRPSHHCWSPELLAVDGVPMSLSPFLFFACEAHRFIYVSGSPPDRAAQRSSLSSSPERRLIQELAVVDLPLRRLAEAIIFARSLTA